MPRRARAGERRQRAGAQPGRSGSAREQRAFDRSAKDVAAGRKTLKEHEAFVEGVLNGEARLPARLHRGQAASVATAAFGIGLVLGVGVTIAGGWAPRYQPVPAPRPAQPPESAHVPQSPPSSQSMQAHPAAGQRQTAKSTPPTHRPLTPAESTRSGPYPPRS